MHFKKYEVLNIKSIPSYILSNVLKNMKKFLNRGKISKI